jgi:hypothetical protein
MGKHPDWTDRIHEFCYEMGKRRDIIQVSPCEKNAGVSARKDARKDSIIKTVYTFCLNWTIQCGLATCVVLHSA